MKTKIKKILFTVLIIAAAWWFKIIWLPLGGMFLVWIDLFRYEPLKTFRRVLKEKHKTISTAFSAILIVALGATLGILFYRFGAELISVPSSSMEKAIPAGKYIIVNKLIPGPRRFPQNPEKYFRMKGTNNLHRGDIVLFNFPEGDTILQNKPDESYYYLKRHYNNFDQLRKVRRWGNLIPLKVIHRPRFVKRLTGLPGDTIEINNGNLFINNRKANIASTVIKKYKWTGTEASFKNVENQIPSIEHYKHKGSIIVEMTTGKYVSLPENLKNKLTPGILEKNVPDRHTFPFNTNTGWNTDYMGPVRIPAKDDSIQLNISNIDIYQRAIKVYEKNKLDISNDTIYINGKARNYYVFKMNYYWVMGDNRPYSFDSRFWGFLPENHLIGKIPGNFVN